MQSKSNFSARGRSPRTCEKIPNDQKHLARRRKDAESENKTKQLFFPNLRASASRREIVHFFTRSEPKDYVPWLNHPQPKEEIENIRYAIKRSRPYGSEPWVSKAVAQFGLENTLRNPWRPEKGT